MLTAITLSLVQRSNMVEYKGIDDIKAKLNSLSKSGAVRRATDLIDQQDLGLIKKITDITSKYADNDWSTKEYITIQTDLIALQAMLVTLATKFGDLMSAKDSDTAGVTTARSKIRLDAKKVKKELEAAGDIVKTTADDIKDLSYVLTEDAAQASEDSSTIGNYLKFIYFAVKDHVQLLERAAARFHMKGE